MFFSILFRFSIFLYSAIGRRIWGAVSVFLVAASADIILSRNVKANRVSVQHKQLATAHYYYYCKITN